MASRSGNAQRAQYPLIKEYSLNHNMKPYIIQAIFLKIKGSLGGCSFFFLKTLGSFSGFKAFMVWDLASEPLGLGGLGFLRLSGF